MRGHENLSPSAFSSEILTGEIMRGQDGVDPKLETLKIGTNCSERRFEWQQPEFSGWNFGLQWRDGY
jgi:hypothetical protein